jgi:hypothetical protein
VAVMEMPTYVQEMEFAAKSYFSTLREEEQTVANLEREVLSLTAQTKGGYERAGSLQNTEDLPGPQYWYDDDAMMGVGVYWETYFGADKDRYYKSQELDASRARLAAHAVSRAAVCGSLLQLAKQGISMVHAKLADCPAGRAVLGGESLKDVICQGRNQSLHWEDGEFRAPVVACFEKLALADNRFAAYKTKNLAPELVDVLGWRDFADFEKDLLSLA